MAAILVAVEALGVVDIVVVVDVETITDEVVDVAIMADVEYVDEVYDVFSVVNMDISDVNAHIVVMRKLWKRIKKTRRAHSESLAGRIWIGICEPWDRSSGDT